MSGSPRPPHAPKDTVTSQMLRDCLRDLRAELARSYPAVRSRALVRTAKGWGLDAFPEGFLVPGILADRSSRGPRALLATTNRSNGGMREYGHPLFSNDFYRLTNPDVTAAGASPWAHYQVFGRAE